MEKFPGQNKYTCDANSFRNKSICLLRLNGVKEVSFECILYWSKVSTRHGPARHGPVRPEIGHAFAKLRTYFIFAPNELKLCIRIDRKLSCRFSQVAKMQEDIFLILSNIFPKTFWAKISKTARNHVSYIPGIHAILSTTLHNSLFINRDCTIYHIPSFI